MKILQKPAPFKINYPKIIKCYRCNCTLEYDEKDLKFTRATFFEYLFGGTSDITIICPECKTKLSVLWEVLLNK